MAINTPRPATKLTPQDEIAARRLRRDLKRDQEICQLQAENLNLRFEGQQRDLRIDHLEQEVREMRQLLATKMPLSSPDPAYTTYLPKVAPPRKPDPPRRVTRPLGPIDQWTTMTEIESVKIPAVQPPPAFALPEQVAQAAVGHKHLRGRDANVAYLHPDIIAELDKKHGIRDMLWTPWTPLPLRLCSDASLTYDQVRCVTSEEYNDETTEKRAAYQLVEHVSAIPERSPLA